MLEKGWALLAEAMIAMISRMGYRGIVLLMGIESPSVPLLCEIIMPISGYLIFQGRLSLGLAVAGAQGVGAAVRTPVALAQHQPVIEVPATHRGDRPACAREDPGHDSTDGRGR